MTRRSGPCVQLGPWSSSAVRLTRLATACTPFGLLKHVGLVSTWKHGITLSAVTDARSDLASSIARPAAVSTTKSVGRIRMLVPGSLNRNLAHSAALALWQGQLEHTVLKFGHDALVVNLGGEGEAARHAAVAGFLHQHAAGLGLLFLFLFHLGCDRDKVAVYVDADVLLLRARYFRADLVLVVGLRYIDLDLARQVPSELRRVCEAAKKSGKKSSMRYGRVMSDVMSFSCCEGFAVSVSTTTASI